MAQLIEIGGGGGVGSVLYREFVFDTTAIPGANVYNNWPALMAAIAALPDGEKPVITFMQSFTIPAGTWNMRLGTWQSVIFATGTVVVTIPDNATIDNLQGIQNGLYVVATPTTADGTTFTFSGTLVPGGPPTVFFVGLGAGLNNQGTKACIDLPNHPGGNYFVFASNLSSFIGPPLTAPFVRNVHPQNNIIASQISSGFYGSIPDGWVEGTAGALLYQNGVDSRTAVTPAWSGTTFPLDTVQSVLNPLSQKGARRSLIYTNGAIGVSETDTFSDWSKLYEVLTLLDAPVEVVFKQVGVPLHIPAGTWIMGERVSSWESANALGNDCQVYLDTGCIIQDLNFIGKNVTVIGNSNAPCLTWTPPVGGRGVVLGMDAGANLANLGTAPMIQWTEDVTNGNLIIGMLGGSSWADTGGPSAILDVTPAGAFSSVAAFFLIGGTVSSRTISGSNGPGSANVIAQLALGGFNTNQPGWAGTPLYDFNVYQPIQVYWQSIRTPTIGNPAGPPYHVLVGNEFVRIDPTGLAPQQMVLPDPKLVPMQTVLMKCVSGAPTQNILVSSDGGALVDGVALLTIPPSAYLFVRFTSDGTAWWVT